MHTWYLHAPESKHFGNPPCTPGQQALVEAVGRVRAQEARVDQRRTAWDCMGCRCMRGDSGAGLSQGRQDRDPASSRRSCGCKVAGIALQLQYEHSSKPLTRPNCSRAQQQAAHTSGEARPPDLRSGKHKTGGRSAAGAQVVGNKKTEVQATGQLRVRHCLADKLAGKLPGRQAARYAKQHGKRKPAGLPAHS